MKIPRQDILRVKRDKLVFFDNSIEVYTTNGKILFTSFFSREKAYQDIIELIEPIEQPEII